MSIDSHSVSTTLIIIVLSRRIFFSEGPFLRVHSMAITLLDVFWQFFILINTAFLSYSKIHLSFSFIDADVSNRSRNV